MTSDDHDGDAFRRVLDEAVRGAQRKGEGPCAALVAPLWVGAGFDLPPLVNGGGEARWAAAVEWGVEPSAPTAPQTVACRSDTAPASADLAVTVANELRFSPDLTEEVLAQRWRAFVWRNHPDRQPIHARERANARVAQANALYDRARDALRRT